MLDEGIEKNNTFSCDEVLFCSSRLRKSNTPFITPWKQGVQLEIDTRHFAASLTSHDFINEPLAPLESSPFPALASRLPPFIVLPCLPVPSLCPPRFRRNSTLLLGRDIDRGFAAEKITAIRDNVAPCTLYPYIPLAFGILDTPR